MRPAAPRPPRDRPGRAAVRRLAAAALLLLACLPAAWAAAADGRSLTLATTTSTENSGLLDRLLPAFEARCGCAVRVLPVGTGKALRIAAAGDADVLLVHSPRDEEAFVAAGHGVARRLVMHNEFVLVGPPDDPAGAAAAGDILAALAAVRDAGAPFVSRGDDSGTHRKERFLWELLAEADGVEVPRDPGWYIEIGGGMGQALLVADQKRAYTLSDRGTFLFFEGKVEMRVVSGGGDDERLYNPYSVIAVNPGRHPHVEHALALKFIDWLVGDEARRLINGHQVRGRQLFFAK